MKQWIIDSVMDGEVVPNIGQIDHETKLALERLIRAGTVSKWRGKWYPVAGASWGLGPDKTCYGLSSKYVE